MGPVEFGLSGGGGAGRFGRLRVRGTTAAARKEKRVKQKEEREHGSRKYRRQKSHSEDRGEQR